MFPVKDWKGKMQGNENRINNDRRMLKVQVIG